MPNLPPSTDFTNSSVTEGQFKTAMTYLREYLASLLGTDGTIATALGALMVAFNSTSSKGVNYTVIASDRGKVIECTATLELALTAAATLGGGFMFVVNNTGTGTVTINPNGTETIDDATTKTIGAGQECIIFCNGSQFFTLGMPSMPGVTSLNGQTGAITNTNYGSIGSYVIAAENTYTAGLERLPDVTVAGSTLVRTSTSSGTSNSPSINLDGNMSVASSSAVNLGLSGTWRRLTRSKNNATSGTQSGGNLYVRVS